MAEPNTLFEVTCRTMQGRFLLRPSGRLNELILGVVGRAMTMYPVRLYLMVVLSNHLHMILSAPDVNSLSLFMNFVNANIAREAGRLHRWHEKFWGRRYTALPILDDAARLSRVRYLLSNGCKEGLVKRPRDWSGVQCVDALCDGKPLKGVWVDRTAQYIKGGSEKDHETTYEVPLSVLPCFTDLSEGERRRQWRGWWRPSRRSSLKTAIRGARPSRRTIAPRRRRKARARSAHAAAAGSAKRYREGYAMFVGAYRRAQERWRQGEASALALFPPDCYIPPLARIDFSSA
ncbi:MAG: transposase [Deltaproteobacteria bacterium]|nr:transposase [Deltaproteobacteria bacterium]